MAGKGTRYTGASHPKVLVPVKPDGDPMFIHAIKNLGFKFDRLILIAQKSHEVDGHVQRLLPGVKSHVIEVDYTTGGPLDSVLLATDLLHKELDDELVVANADQVMAWPGDWALGWFRGRGATGGIPTLEAHSERHSYARIDAETPHRIVEVREKIRISKRATIGIYWFRRSGQFLQAAQAMREADDRAPNGEFYVGPVYNYLPGLILEFPLCEFWSLGEPSNLRAYEDRDYAAMRYD
jgi:hypothetical protein